MKGMALEFMMALIGLGIFAIVFVIFSKPMEVVFTYSQSATTDATSLSWVSWAYFVVWTFWPLFILFGGFIVYLLVKSQRPTL